MIASILASALALTAVQTADEFEGLCLEFQAEYGGGADCSCLADAVAEDNDLAAMMAEITTVADLESAPSEVTDAIAACTE